MYAHAGVLGFGWNCGTSIVFSQNGTVKPLLLLLPLVMYCYLFISTCHVILEDDLYDALPEPSEDEEDMLDQVI